MSLDQLTVTPQVYDLRQMGVACDAVLTNGVWSGTDDRAILQRALDVINASGGGIAWFPAFALVGRAGASAWCLTLNSYKNVTLRGPRGQGGIVQAAGLPDASIAVVRANLCSDCVFDQIYISGNWGNAVSTILPGSNNAQLPQAIINVKDTSNFPVAGTAYIVTPNSVEAITYTGKTATSLTGCAGGTAIINAGQKIGYIDGKTGINQTTQGDPQNYGLMIRGGQNIAVRNCRFENTYGDAIWIGGSTDLTNVAPRNIRLLDNDISISARNGVTLIGGRDIIIDGNSIESVFASTIDSEPVGGFVRDVKIHDNDLVGWPDPGVGGGGQIVMTIVGGATNFPSEVTAARGYRVTDNKITGGGVLISEAYDCTFDGNRVVIDFFTVGTQGTAPIAIVGACDAIRVRDNYIYDRVPGNVGSDHEGSIVVNMAGAGTLRRNQPTNILISGNSIKCRNGIRGISVAGAGGGAVGSVYTLTETGNATDVTGTTMTDAGKAWAVNQWSGWLVRIGTATAAIASNTGTVLTLDPGAAEFAALAWCDPLGERAPTPAAGAYTIFKLTGTVEIASNHIDCSNDGRGQGGVGIYLDPQIASTTSAGMRAWVHHNNVKNCTADGIFVKWRVPNYQQLWIHDNTGHDDQDVPTLTTLLRFDGVPNANQLLLRNNQPGTTVIAAVAGLTTGRWLVSGGIVPTWAGYGSPEGILAAGVGAMYQRVDGGPSTVLYLKESGTGNTGWQPYASPASQIIANTFNISPIGDGASTLWNDGPPFTIVGTASQPGVNDGTLFSRTRKVKYTSAAGAGSIASLRNGGGLNFLRGSGIGGGYRIVWRFTIGDAVIVPTANMFVGLVNTIAAPIDVAPSTLTNVIGVGVDSGDTTLQLYGAGAIAQPRIDLGASFPANTSDVDVYELELVCVGGELTVSWRVRRLNTNDIASGSLAGAQIPAAGQTMTTQAYRSNGGTAAAVAFSHHQLYSEVPI